mgnify:CR=1 FL=1
MEILIKPIITEKMTSLAEKLNRYGFVVDRSANKVQIRQAVEKMYGVKVESVNTQQYVGKVKTRNTTRGIAVGRVNRSKRAFGCTPSHQGPCKNKEFTQKSFRQKSNQGQAMTTLLKRKHIASDTQTLHWITL